MALLYEDLVRAQTANPPVYGPQGQVMNPEKANVIPPAPLPQLTPQTQSQPVQQPAAVDPITKFNQGILDMLKQAQQASGAYGGAPFYSPLLNEQNRLQTQQITNSMAPASQLGIENLRPGDALNARENAGRLYNPEINNLTQRVQASRDAINAFKDSLDAARKYSEQYAAAIKPDEQTIKAIQDMLIAGETPPKSVLDSAYKYIDWTAVAAGKKTSGAGSDLTSDQKEYAQAVEQGFKGTLLQFLDRKSSSGSGETKAAKLTAAENKADTILYSQRGTDGYVSPETWYAARNAWKADGFSASDFDKKFENYTNPADPQDYGLS